ncbi:MAG: tetratricopeptide repeat protein [Gemmatimonadetes bacterium]|nr:tetratricopeptide repeat protein [Gemmatimonadota bacterium]MDA1104364.1 tetratricopeptide repeat protein [Gemmatimonadota bacterium]
MKIRYGLVLAMVIGLGLTGCASGGGTGGGGTPQAGGGSGSIGAGENPRDTENTRAAERALDDAEDADDPAQARMHYEQALASAQAAIAEDGRNPLAHRLAALASIGVDDYESASAHFDHAVELRPLYEFTFGDIREGAWLDQYDLATPHVQSGDYEAAAVYFERANAIYRDRPEAMITLGQIYAQLRQHDAAIENLDAALAFMDSDVASLADEETMAGWQEQVADLPLLRAQVLADAGRFEEAVVTYRELSAADPGNVELKRGLAAILGQMGNDEEAFVVYQELMAAPGLSAQDLFTIGVGFYQGSDYTMAGQAFGKAAGVSRNDRDAIEMWARSLQLDSLYADVPPVAQRWIALDPNSQNAYLILAQAANQNGDQATTQSAISTVDGLDVSMNDLQLQRYSAGGAMVSGSLINKKLAAGASVSIRFTFYADDGSAIGTVTEPVTVGAADMAEVFQVEFASAQMVGGYGYALTIG